MSNENTPRNFEKEVVDQEMIFASLNFQTAPNSVVFVTGFPEGAGEYAGEKKIYSLMKKIVDSGAGFLQLYMGKKIAKIKKNSENLQKALKLTKEKKNVTLVLFSAGALSIKNIEIPDNIKRIVFVSPVIGKEIIRHKKKWKEEIEVQVMILLFSIPKIKRYFESIEPLVQRAKEKNIEVEVILTDKDGLLKQKETENAFKEYFGIKAQILKGDHAPELDDLGKVICPSNRE